MQRQSRASQWERAFDRHLVAVVRKDLGLGFKEIGAALGASVARARRCVALGPRLTNAAAAAQRRIVPLPKKGRGEC
jgi:hypothetical protein